MMPDICEIWCWIQPNAKTTGFVGIYQSCYKIRLKAPAVDGKANLALIEFLADSFQVSQSAIQITHGETQRKKRVKVHCNNVKPMWLEL